MGSEDKGGAILKNIKAVMHYIQVFPLLSNTTVNLDLFNLVSVNCEHNSDLFFFFKALSH